MVSWKIRHLKKEAALEHPFGMERDKRFRGRLRKRKVHGQKRKGS